MEREVFFTFKDIKNLFMRKKRLYFRLFFSVFILVFSFTLLKPPLYKASAAFKCAGTEGGEADLIRSFLQSTPLAKRESGVASILESRTLLKQVVQDQGFTLKVKTPFLQRGMQVVKDRLFTELGISFKERDPIHFLSTVFEGEKFKDFFLVFSKEGHFDVLNEKEEIIAKGRFGVPVRLQQGTFIVEETSSPILSQLYRIQVIPWIDVIKKVRSHLVIKESKKDKNILLITYADGSSKRAALLPNELMASYQSYLKDENETLAKMQMEYLGSRQSELIAKYEQSLEEHSLFLEKSLEEGGFLTFKQEVAFLEKPNEEYLSKLYDVDLKLNKIQEEKDLSTFALDKKHQKEEIELCLQKRPKKSRNHTELDGMSLEMTESLLSDYSKEKDQRLIHMEQMQRLQKEIGQKGFEITSLSGILTDGVSQDLIQKAGKIALEIQDTTNYSSKDVERLQEALSVQKQVLIHHMAQQVAVDRHRIHLLDDKIDSLQEAASSLLTVEKGLIEKQIDSLQDKMKTLPEKWKRENQLLMQRELSMGVVEGLTQLSESKNIHHRLFQVESKPIDKALPPYKPAKGYGAGWSLILSVLSVCFFFAYSFMCWLLKGTAITESSAVKLGATFCGFLKKHMHTKEPLRKMANFIASHKKEDRASVITLLSKESSLGEDLSELLSLRGEKVLLIECTCLKINRTEERGLYDFLLGKGPATIVKQEGFDQIFAGRYEGHFIELLSRKIFSEFLQVKSLSYDIILLTMEAEPSDVSVEPLKAVSDGFIVHAEDVLYEEVSSFPDIAVVLT